MAITTQEIEYIRSRYESDSGLQAIIAEHGMLAFQLASVEIYNENSVSRLIQQAGNLGSVQSPNWIAMKAVANSPVDPSLMKQFAETASAAITRGDSATVLPLLIGLLACVRSAHTLPAIS